MKKGDFIKIDFVGKVVATNEIFDLTSEGIAKEKGIYSEGHRYGPLLVIMGADMVVPGLEKRLEVMQPCGEREFNLKPEEAFGRRDLKLIKILPRANFIKQKINPVPGIFVTINGQQARIQSVSGGRIRVDFNHPLAGKEVRYKVRIVEQIKGPLEKAKAMIEYYGIKAETKMEGGKLHISTVKPMPDVAKKLIEEKMKKWIDEVKHISFFSKEKKKKPGEAGKAGAGGDAPSGAPPSEAPPTEAPAESATAEASPSEAATADATPAEAPTEAIPESK